MCSTERSRTVEQLFVCTHSPSYKIEVGGSTVIYRTAQRGDRRISFLFNYCVEAHLPLKLEHLHFCGFLSTDHSITITVTQSSFILIIKSKVK